jgi:hypothetical protein
MSRDTHATPGHARAAEPHRSLGRAPAPRVPDARHRCDALHDAPGRVREPRPDDDRWRREGRAREFYSRYFVPQMPPDTEIVPVSRTVGADRIVDEMIFRFTHTIDMEWMLPGVPPTGKRVEIATSTGTRPRCWRSWACWNPVPVTYPSPAWRPPARSVIRPCRRTSSSGAPRSPRADPRLSFATGAGRESASAASPPPRALPAPPPPQSPPVS